MYHHCHFMLLYASVFLVDLDLVSYTGISAELFLGVFGHNDTQMVNGES